MASINFDLKDIKPLLSGLKLGDAPDTTPKPLGAVTPPPMTPQAPLTPPPPQATPAVAGFSEWSADPMNQQKVAHGITQPGQPIIPQNVRQQATEMASLAPPTMPSGPTMASISGPPVMPAPASPQTQELTQKVWEQQNPDQTVKPQLVGQGLKRGLLFGGVGALQSLASGIKPGGDPLAGMGFINQQVTRDQQAPELNRARYNAAVIQPEKDAAALADTQSQTAQRNALAAKANAQADNVGDTSKQKAKDIDNAAKLGSKPVYDDKGNLTGYTPDENSTIYKKNQALAQYEQARSDAAKARADLDKSRNDPKSPAFLLAQGRLRVAQQNAQTAISRLGLSTQEFEFNQDKFYNPQPTSTERNKGDLAQSALERVQEMRAVVNKHPEWFGPIEGRASNVQAAIGSQDPDIQTYLSAAQYLSDHSAGVFGGRGKYITEQLHSLTDPKMNPGALGAALDEAERSAQGFVKAGTPHQKGGTSSYSGNTATPSGGVEEYVRVNGKLVKKGGK